MSSSGLICYLALFIDIVVVCSYYTVHLKLYYNELKYNKSNYYFQFGLLDIPDVDMDEPMDLSDDDIDLEAELAAISGGRKPRSRKPAPAAPADLDAMIAASLKDIPSDDDVSGLMNYK